MPIKFNVKITDQDMYRFHMYHMYRSFHGVFSIIAAIIAFVVAVVTWGGLSASYTVLYVVFGIVFLFYFPVTLKMKAKSQIAMSEALKEALEYAVDEEGIHVSQKGENACLQWKQVYKMVTTKHNVLIYSSRVNAYVIPRTIIGTQYQALKELADSKLEKYQNCMK